MTLVQDRIGPYGPGEPRNDRPIVTLPLSLMVEGPDRGGRFFVYLVVGEQYVAVDWVTTDDVGRALATFAQRWGTALHPQNSEAV